MNHNSSSAVIKLDSYKDSAPLEIVSCDFGEIDAIRKMIRKLVPKFNKSLEKHQGRYASYDSSTFYIGRGVTRVHFKNLYVSSLAMKRIVDHLVTKFPHGYVVVGTNLHVYMRGSDKSRLKRQ